jgi:phosphatidylglycerophosphate synthase
VISLYDASAGALTAFLVLGAIDGVYLHLWRYRLHARPESTREHRFHTAAAVLFAATLPALYLWATAGWLLWCAVLLVAADLVVSIADMRAERDSRAGIGGLSTGEYVLHMLLMSLRGAALALAFAARPAEAWSLDGPPILGSLPPFASAIAWQVLPGTIAVAVLHVWLCLPAGVSRFERWRQRAPRWTACCAWPPAPRSMER